MKIYVGCSLTHAPETFKESIEIIKNDLRTDFEVLDFVGLTSGNPEDVYTWDIHECVSKCDAFIAFVDHPALGLGYELGVAVEKLNTPTLALAHKDAHVTRLICGITQPHFSLMRYSSAEEATVLIRDFLKTLK